MNSLGILLNRATKPKLRHGNHNCQGSLSVEARHNEKEEPRRYSSYSQHGGNHSLGTLNIPESSSSPHIKTDYAVIVANCGECNCSAFIQKLLKSAGKSIKTDRQTYTMSFRIDNIAKYITLIEVDFQKHDLWSTLSFEGCILLYSPNIQSSYKCAVQKLSQLGNRKERCVLWLVGIVSDPASSTVPPRIVPYEQAEAYAQKIAARYWEVMPDGKTARSPLAYNQIVMELVSLVGDLQVDETANDKIKFEFSSHAKAIRKISRSCEYISFT